MHKIEARVEDLYSVPQHGKAEILDGELVLMGPTGALPNRAAGAIYLSLRLYERKTGRGFAYTGNAAFIVNLPRRKSFTPDAAFHPSPPTMKFVGGTPVFAAEVRSEGDYGEAAEKAMARKRADYFAAGTLVVWDVDLLSDDVVRMYRASSPTEPAIYRRGEAAAAEPALPGWTMPVDELFS